MSTSNAYGERWEEDALIFERGNFTHVLERMSGGALKDIMCGNSRCTAQGNGQLLKMKVEASRLVYTDMEWKKDWQHGSYLQLCISLRGDPRGVWIRSQRVYCEPVHDYIYAWRVYCPPSLLRWQDFKTLGALLEFDRFFPPWTGKSMTVVESHVQDLMVYPAKTPKLRTGLQAVQKGRSEFVSWTNQNSTCVVSKFDAAYLVPYVEAATREGLDLIVPTAWKHRYDTSNWAMVKPKRAELTPEHERVSLLRYLAYSWRRCNLFYAYRTDDMDRDSPHLFIRRALVAEGSDVLWTLIQSYDEPTPLRRVYLAWESAHFSHRPEGQVEENPSPKRPKRVKTNLELLQQQYKEFLDDEMSNNMLQQATAFLRRQNHTEYAFLPQTLVNAGLMEIEEAPYLDKIMNRVMLSWLRGTRWCRKSMREIWPGFWKTVAIAMGLGDAPHMRNLPPTKGDGTYNPLPLWVLWGAAQATENMNVSTKHMFVFRIAPIEVEYRKVTADDFKENFRIVVLILSKNRDAWVYFDGSRMDLFGRNFVRTNSVTLACGCQTCGCESMCRKEGACPWTKHCTECPVMLVDDATLCCARTNKHSAGRKASNVRKEQKPASDPQFPVNLLENNPYALALLAKYRADNYAVSRRPFPCQAVCDAAPNRPGGAWNAKLNNLRHSVATLLPLTDADRRLVHHLPDLEDVDLLKRYLKGVVRSWFPLEKVATLRMDYGYVRYHSMNDHRIPWAAIAAETLRDDTALFPDWMRQHAFVAVLQELIERIKSLVTPEDDAQRMQDLPATMYDDLPNSLPLQRMCTVTVVTEKVPADDRWVDPATRNKEATTSAQKSTPSQSVAPLPWRGRAMPMTGKDYTTEDGGPWPPFLVPREFCPRVPKKTEDQWLQERSLVYDDLLDLKIPHTTNPGLVARGMSACLAAANNDEQLLAGLTAVIRCCYPDIQEAHLEDFRVELACLFGESLSCETGGSASASAKKKHKSAFAAVTQEGLNGKNELTEHGKRCLANYFAYVVSRAAGRHETYDDPIMRGVCRFFNCPEALLHFSAAQSMWVHATAEKHEVKDRMMQRFGGSDVMHFMAFFEVMTKLSSKDRASFFPNGPPTYREWMEDQTLELDKLRDHVAPLLVIPAGSQQRDPGGGTPVDLSKAVSFVREHHLLRYATELKLFGSARSPLDEAGLAAKILEMSRNSLPQLSENMRREAGPLFLRPLPYAEDGEPDDMMLLAFHWFYRFQVTKTQDGRTVNLWTYGDGDKWAADGATRSPIDGSVNYGTLFGYVLRGGLAQRGTKCFALYRNLPESARWCIVNYLRMRKSAWQYWFLLGLQRCKTYPDCHVSQLYVVKAVPKTVPVGTKSRLKLLRLKSNFAVWRAFAETFGWVGNYWAGDQSRDGPPVPVWGSLYEVFDLRDRYSTPNDYRAENDLLQKVTNDLKGVFDTCWIEVGPWVEQESGEQHLVIRFGPHKSGLEVPGIGMWKVNTGGVEGKDPVHVCVHTSNDEHAMAQWLVTSRGVPIANRACSGLTEMCPPVEGIRKGFEVPLCLYSTKELYGCQAFDVSYNLHDNRRQPNCEATITGGLFEGTYLVVLAARTPYEALLTYKIVAKQKWGKDPAECKPQGVSQDARAEYIESGGPGISYTPQNKHKRVARIIPPERMSVQALLIPKRRLQEFVVACKAAVAYRNTIDNDANFSGWTPATSSTASEREGGLFVEDTMGKYHMMRNKLSEPHPFG